MSTVVVYRHDRRRRVTLVLLVLTSLALISLDERGSSLIDSARSAAQDFVAPVQRLADDAVNPASDFFSSLGRANELQDQNVKLRQELAQARSAAAAGAGARARLKELTALADLPNVADPNGVVAEVVAQETGNLSRSFRISKGSDAGIAKGMPVVVADASGDGALVGQVYSVSNTSAIVRRIDDREFGVGAQLVQGTAFGPKGTASGQADSSLLRFSVIQDTGAAVAMKKGDVAITLGGTLFEAYPRGLVIGTVARSVAVGGSIARDASLRPVVDLDRLDVVKVLKFPSANP
jgi:rod shape-determining protein MreC